MEKTRFSTFTGFTVMFLLCHVHVISSTAGASKKRTTCGGDLSGPSGIIESPNHPSNYPANAHCIWTISVPEGSEVILIFETFQIESGSSCPYDYLEIRDGQNSSSKLLAKLCGFDLPSPFVSTSNTMTLVFISDSSTAYTGYRATYHSGTCREDLFGESGFIKSPNYPGNYPSMAHCIWRIRVPEGNRVILYFKTFELEGNYCSYDYLEILDGYNSSSRRLAKLCGGDLPSPYISSGNTMTLILITDGTTVGGGFRAEFQSVTCGADLVSASGIIETPNHPRSYPSSAQCTWRIRVPEGYRVILHFEMFQLEGGSCSYDYLEILDGYNSSSRRLATLCGGDLPSPYISSENTMTLKLITDGTTVGGGFRAEFQSVTCGADLFSTSGIIETPNHPRNYPSSAQCTWRIRVPEGSRVILHFEMFQLEGGSCSYDYLEILDGYKSSRRLARLCGSDLPSPYMSSDNTMTLTFISDSSIVASGFRAKFESVPADVSSNTPHRKKRSTCGFELFGHSGVIESPNYPNNYPSYARCTWTIRAPQRSRIVLRFEAFETENSCEFDRLEVRDGPHSGSNLLKQMCGTSIPLPIESSGNTMTLLFKSDGSVEKQGFKAEFQSVMDCGGELTSEDGDVTSPNYPQKYDKLQDCVWVITVPNDYQVQLRFRSFQLENSHGCVADFVEVQDGSKATAPYLGRFCGSELPNEIRSSGNVMMIKFVSDDRDEKRGFSAHFQKVLPAIEEPKSMGIRNMPAVLMICTMLCFILPTLT